MTQHTIPTPIAAPVSENAANLPQSLSTWFLSAYTRSSLPVPPFQLRQGLTVLGGKFYDRLHFEILKVEATGTSPRFHTGALQRDLQDLYRLTVEANQPKLKLSALQRWELENLDSLEEVA